jgi:hypothetical protein
MSTESDFLRDMARVIEHSKELRAVLARYEEGSANVARRVKDGEPLADALQAEHGPLQRQEVTEAIEKLEGARHQVRLSMFSLAKEQGTSISELSRQLGISRQLGSRLAGEADR